MAYPSVTYTFTNGTTASATEVNQNFTDLINGLSDGTKDLSISALTVAGTASLNGAVNLGNATSDDIAVNGYITTALIPKADDTYDLGTAALAWQDGYFEGKVYTDSIKALTSAGVTITDDGDVACVTCADGGAVTIGPAASTAKNLFVNGSSQNTYHSEVKGTNITSEANKGVTDFVSTRMRFVAYGANASQACGFQFRGRSSDASIDALFAECDTTGAWTLGLGSGTADTIHVAQNRTTTTSSPVINMKKGANDTTTSNKLITFEINNGASGSGQINANGANACAFGSYSDARLKHNIVPLAGELAKVLALNPVEFDWKTGGHQVGFIAQEIEEVYPDAVNYIGKTEEMKTVTGWDKTTARLVKAIQELEARLAALEAR
jgi:hypothetical protein